MNKINKPEPSVPMRFTGSVVGEMYAGPVWDISIGRLHRRPEFMRGPELPHSIAEAYVNKCLSMNGGMCCVITGHYESPNKPAFDRLETALASVPEVWVYHEAPSTEYPEQMSSGFRHPAHVIYFVGNIKAGLEAIKVTEGNGIWNYYLRDTIKIVEQQYARTGLVTVLGARQRETAPMQPAG